jgi:chemotaxis protein CheX
MIAKPPVLSRTAEKGNACLVCPFLFAAHNDFINTVRRYLMNVNLVNPFISAVTEVMPQLGFQEIKRSGLRLSDQIINCKGITAIVGLTKQLKGNVAYNMTDQTAMKFASTMMMGMPVASLDELAQSAISELVNMITANAAIQLEKTGVLVDISPPTVIVGSGCTAKLCAEKYIVIDMVVDGETLEINVGLDE